MESPIQVVRHLPLFLGSRFLVGSAKMLRGITLVLGLGGRGVKLQSKLPWREVGAVESGGMVRTREPSFGPR